MLFFVFVFPWRRHFDTETCRCLLTLMYVLYLIVCIFWQIQLIIRVMNGTYTVKLKIYFIVDA